MSSKKKLPPHEAWDALEKMALHDEAERVGALSDAELDAELAEEGMDPKALRARGAALAAQLKASAPAPVVPLPAKAPPRKRWAALLLAATLAALVVAVALPMAVSVVGKGNNTQERASALRRDALRACGERRWLDCRRGLDSAKGLDPEGEQSDEIKRARRAIEAALRERTEGQ
jgi:hypothetical protein